MVSLRIKLIETWNKQQFADKNVKWKLLLPSGKKNIFWCSAKHYHLQYLQRNLVVLQSLSFGIESFVEISKAGHDNTNGRTPFRIFLFVFTVGADGRSELGLKLDSLGLGQSSSRTSLTSFDEKFDDSESPESSLNRQVRKAVFRFVIVYLDWSHCKYLNVF